MSRKLKVLFGMLVILIIVAFFWLQSRTRCLEQRTTTVHKDQVITLVLIGKAQFPQIIPAHDEQITKCVKWAERFD